MTTSSIPTATAAAQNVRVTDRALVVELRDGRVVSVPLTWYPRLAQGSPRERKRWKLLGPWHRHSLARTGRGHFGRRPSRGRAVRRQCDIAGRMACTSEESDPSRA